MLTTWLWRMLQTLFAAIIRPYTLFYLVILGTTIWCMIPSLIHTATAGILLPLCLLLITLHFLLTEEVFEWNQNFYENRSYHALCQDQAAYAQHNQVPNLIFMQGIQHTLPKVDWKLRLNNTASLHVIPDNMSKEANALPTTSLVAWNLPFLQS
jgi:hypothetical protein